MKHPYLLPARGGGPMLNTASRRPEFAETAESDDDGVLLDVSDASDSSGSDEEAFPFKVEDVLDDRRRGQEQITFKSPVRMCVSRISTDARVINGSERPHEQSGIEPGGNTGNTVTSSSRCDTSAYPSTHVGQTLQSQRKIAADQSARYAPWPDNWSPSDMRVSVWTPPRSARSRIPTTVAFEDLNMSRTDRHSNRSAPHEMTLYTRAFFPTSTPTADSGASLTRGPVGSECLNDTERVLLHDFADTIGLGGETKWALYSVKVSGSGVPESNTKSSSIDYNGRWSAIREFGLGDWTFKPLPSANTANIPTGVGQSTSSQAPQASAVLSFDTTARSRGRGG